MAIPYVPTTFYKDAETVLAESWQEHHQLLWDGWSLIGPPPETPRTGQHVTFGDLPDILAPLIERIRVLEAGGGVTPVDPTDPGGEVISIFSVDTDGYPYLNDSAGAAGSPVSVDTDGYPYLNALAGTTGSGIGVDTDGVPYLIGA